MKRELKLIPLPAATKKKILDCKAYPDEKGIETTPINQTPGTDVPIDCKAYPDEKGIETPPSACSRWYGSRYCKAYPDEKGIETLINMEERFSRAFIIAKPIPMKRELKPIMGNH